VLEYRLKSEYGVDILRTPLNYRLARWVKSEVEDFDYHDLTLTSTSMLVLDRDDEPVVLFESEWAVDWAVDHNEPLKLHFEDIHSK
ncbi:MAG: peptide chain release factor 3, partial [Clostridiales bacterium]|nr:peptide chain release factor 3 [Clostridiales bacterium]